MYYLKRLLDLSLSLSLFLFAGCNSTDDNGVALITLSGAYKLSTGIALQQCNDYSIFNQGNHLYWLDPDGVNTGVDEFIAECDMDAGGYAVISATTTPSLPVNNLTDTTLEFFSDLEIAQINALRSTATEIRVESDFTIRFLSDTSAGGCGGAPVISNGDMAATTIPLAIGDNITETVHTFAGSADNVDLQFNNLTNLFAIASANPSPGCADTIISNFDISGPVIIKSLKLQTDNATRAASRASGTYYRIRIK